MSKCCGTNNCGEVSMFRNDTYASKCFLKFHLIMFSFCCFIYFFTAEKEDRKQLQTEKCHKPDTNKGVKNWLVSMA